MQVVTLVRLMAAVTLLLYSCSSPARPAPAHVSPRAGSAVTESKPVVNKTLMHLRGVITGQSVSPLVDNMDALIANSYEGQVDLVIDSPGGSVFAGLGFISRMRSLQEMGAEFHCYVTGMAASMAFQILTECDERTQLETSLLLWHPVRIGFMGIVTADIAKQMARDLELTDQFVISQLIEALSDLSREDIMSHFRAETFWSGFSLEIAAPVFSNTVRSLDGKLLTALPKAVTSEESTMFDLFKGGVPTLIHVYLGGIQ